ncbi:MAG: DUF421 domain-containing protein [Hamadaea sp.]|nr:DUF421 domain-containing protein [Hamadaea sp.]
MDWRELFVPQVSPLEIIVRGSIMYLALFTLMRVVQKREAGATSVSDLLVVVLIADAAQNGMSGQYVSITNGLLLVLVIVGWSYLLDRAAYHWPWARRLLRPQPLRLVREGRMLKQNMRRELMTAEELRSQLREQGVDDLAEVKEAWMEPDGRLSVIQRGEEQHQPPPKKSGQSSG